MTPAQEHNLKMLKRSVHRLSHLVDGNAPEMIISREIAILTRVAKIAFQGEYWRGVAAIEQRNILASQGFCVDCQCERDVQNSDTCSKCEGDHNIEYRNLPDDD